LGPPDFHSYVETYLGDRWYLFYPSGISPRMGLLRIGTGRDASDVSFATIFGSVQWTMPKIHIDAHGDEANGIVLPFRQDYAISTDAAGAQPEEAAELLQAQDSTVKDRAAPAAPA
jgi:hypothetical protein